MKNFLWEVLYFFMTIDLFDLEKQLFCFYLILRINSTEHD
jgi:hypothetical protein